MKHEPLVDVQSRAEVLPADVTFLTKRQRLERWAELLEREGSRNLCSLTEIEHLNPVTRAEYRRENSPFAIAFADPVLREAGLKSDRLGDALEFFGIKHHQIHYAFCSCHVGSRVRADHAAHQVRGFIPKPPLLTRLRAWLGYSSPEPR